MSADWKKSCLDLVDEPSGLPGCLTTCFCPCLTYGVLLQKLEGAPAEDNVFFAGQCMVAGGVYFCCLPLGCLLHIPVRQHIRKKYGIKAPQHGILEDLALTWCCPCCTMIQEYNEVLLQSGGKEGTYFADLQGAAAKSGKEVTEATKKAVDDAKQAAEKKMAQNKEDAAAKEAGEKAKEVAKAADEKPAAATPAEKTDDAAAH